MFSYLVVISISFTFSNGYSGVHTVYATKGSIWPAPQIQIEYFEDFKFDPKLFKVTITDQNCDILTEAVSRYLETFKILHEVMRRYRTKNDTDESNSEHNVKELMITLVKPCENVPYYGMDETYILNVTETPVLASASIWGILRGLESFSQLFYITDNFTEVRLNATYIIDFPRYAHRGLLIDTSRHYISVENIRKTLDAMAMNKMNVLHWHIVDDESFPYQSEIFPHLSTFGAYHYSMVYKKSDIANIIEYARLRGIRVIPEFNVPGHTQSWGLAYPYLLTQCGDFDKGPMNPVKRPTYNLLRDLFNEVQGLFTDKFFHIGLSEVNTSCWLANPGIRKYMKRNGLKSSKDLLAMFVRKAIELFDNTSTVIVWQDAIDRRVPLPKNVIVQIAKPALGHYMGALSAGHRVLFSRNIIIDNLYYLGRFQDLYSYDPRQMLINKALPGSNIKQTPELIIGGEACLWGEKANNNNFLTRIWPHGSLIAERLWSSKEYVDMELQTYRRIEEHTCRMIRLGVPAQPASAPGFCLS